MRFKPEVLKFAETALWCLGAMLIVVLLIELSADYKLTGAEQAKQQRAAEATVATAREAPVLSGIETYDAIVQRPLFSVTRRPAAPNEQSAATNPAATGSAESLQLFAIVIADGRNIALIQSGLDRQAHRIAAGETINGWTLSDVQPQSVTLRKGSETRRLQLPVPASERPVVPATAVPAARVAPTPSPTARSSSTPTPTPTPTEEAPEDEANTPEAAAGN